MLERDKRPLEFVRMILAGDIGGTKHPAGSFPSLLNEAKPVVIDVFPSAGRSGPIEIIREFLSKHDRPKIESACFGIAGPVRNGVTETPNLPWRVSAAELAADLGLKSALLVNDLEVNAHGIAVLEPEDFEVLNAGAADASGNRALISAGTGLGEAGLFADGDTYRPFPSEGGHADFAPRDKTEIALLEYLLTRFDHVSFERVLSGPGLYNLYQFFRDTGRAPEPAWLADEISQGDPSAIISKHAAQNTEDLCVQAMDQFVAIYGAEAGNLALKGNGHRRRVSRRRDRSEDPAQTQAAGLYGGFHREGTHLQTT